MLKSSENLQKPGCPEVFQNHPEGTIITNQTDKLGDTPIFLSALDKHNAVGGPAQTKGVVKRRREALGSGALVAL